MNSLKSHDSGVERSLSRRLGIRDLPMPPMPSDADDDEEEMETVSEQDLQKKEEALCDIVKSFVRTKQVSPRPAESCQQPQQQYVYSIYRL